MNHTESLAPDTSVLPSLQDIGQPGQCLLEDVAIIRVSGPDRVRFLQGQLTSDLNEITANQSRLSACCTPKGRMLAMFRMAVVGEEIWMRLPREVAEPLVTHLKKFMVFFKCQMQLDEDLAVLALTAPQQLPAQLPHWPEATNESVATGFGVAIRSFGSDRYELWGSRESLADCMSAMQTASMTPARWQIEEILEGLGEVYVSTREEFIPQMLNLQSLGGISFKKGCYTGQEIVARMQYLGTLKKRMFRAKATVPVTSAPGTAVHDASGAAVGTLVRAQTTAEGEARLLVVLNQEAVANAQTFFLQEEQGQTQLQWEDVPYPVASISNERKKV